MPIRLVALLTLALPAANAQDAWSTLTPSLGISAPPLDRFEDWDAAPGIAGRVLLPAYGGRVRAALDVRRSTATREPLPGYRSTATTLGWGPTAALPAGVRLSGGVLVGALHLRFEPLEEIGEDEFQNVTELEAVVGGWARLSVPLAGRLRLWGEAEVLRVALADPAAVGTVSGGLALRLDTPRWLRGVLR